MMLSTILQKNGQLLVYWYVTTLHPTVTFKISQSRLQSIHPISRLASSLIVSNVSTDRTPSILSDSELNSNRASLDDQSDPTQVGLRPNYILHHRPRPNFLNSH